MRTVYIACLILLIWRAGFVGAIESHVTVYNQDLALVKQVRTLEIAKDDRPLRFTDVAARLIPTSVHLRPVGGDQTFQIVEQNFEYDLVSSEKILEKYIDHSIEIIKENGGLINGVLLSRQGGTLVLRTVEGIKILPWNNQLTVNVTDLPEGLITRPTLIWEVTGLSAGEQTVEVSYLTKGMDWYAEYVGVLDADSQQLDLEAWVSVNNQCGTTFEDAKLKLVAGEVHRAPPPQARQRTADTIKEFAGMVPAPAFEERALFEYHIYELERATSLKHNQIKQIALFAPTRVKSEKKFFYNARQNADQIAVRLWFKNEADTGLGQPLPAGVFRIYQKDQESLEFIGEDRIEHTPRKEAVKITLGRAFDLRGERKVVNRAKVSKRAERQTIEIELRNNKPEKDVTIVVEEALYHRDWKIEETNFPYTQTDAHNIEFVIGVKANSKVTLKYTVLYTW